MGPFDQILPAVAFVKRIDGLSSLCTTPKKKLLIAGSQSLVWVCEMVLVNPADMFHQIKEVGEIWIHTSLKPVILHPITEKHIELHIGLQKFSIVFEKEASCLKWKAFFSVWVAGLENEGMSSGLMPGAQMFMRSREVEID